MINIHKPKLQNSNQPTQQGNSLKLEIIGTNEIRVTERWEVTPSRKYEDAGVETANKGYKWITDWKLGNNYIVTQIYNDKNELVGTYWDMTSNIRGNLNEMKTFDWYLDIFKTRDGVVHVLDEDELKLAVEAGYLTNNEENTITKRAAEIVRTLKGQ